MNLATATSLFLPASWTARRRARASSQEAIRLDASHQPRPRAFRAWSGRAR